MGVFVVNFAPNEGWVAFTGAWVEFEIFVEEKAPFFVGYDMVSQLEHKVAKGIQQTFVFLVEELSLTLCKSTSDDELVCEVGVRFADCGNGDVVARERVSAGRRSGGESNDGHALSGTLYRVISEKIELTILDLGDLRRVVGRV